MNAELNRRVGAFVAGVYILQAPIFIPQGFRSSLARAHIPGMGQSVLRLREGRLAHSRNVKEPGRTVP